MACAALGGCGGPAGGDARLATRCIQASRDARVIHTASLLTDAEIETVGDLLIVRTRMPIGIGLDLKLHFREWTYRCRRDGDRLEFLDYTRGERVK